MIFFPSFHLSSVLFLIVLTVGKKYVNAKQRFEALAIKARVKDHLAEKEDYRRIILSWDHIPKADRYEVCHNCIAINDETGEGALDGGEGVSDGGKIYPIGVDNAKYQCGGLPCFVMRDAPIGYNKFHLRVFVNGEWSLWSEYRNYEIDDIGHVEHEEL